MRRFGIAVGCTAYGLIALAIMLVSALAFAAVPASAQLMGAADSVSGTLMPLRVYDADTAGGNDFRLGTVPLLAGAGGGTPASAGAGAVDAGTQRTTLAADDPAVVSLGTLDDVVGAPAAAASSPYSPPDPAPAPAPTVQP